MRELNNQDYVGIGWRKALAPNILMNLDQIDVVEVILDDYFDLSKAKLDSLKLLTAQVPVLFHGVTLGLASTVPADPKRLKKIKKILQYLNVSEWSEHLAFVRAGGYEIGHLAAPPRTESTILGTIKNLEKIKRRIGSLPALENVATLIDPPGSTFSEPDWIREILLKSGCNLLLDLHNLYTNAINFSKNPFEYLLEFPLEKVRYVHLSGGRNILEPLEYKTEKEHRVLDDHLHDIPEIVYRLLTLLAAHTQFPLVVIIERDGAYPKFPVILSQIKKARLALALGRNEKNKMENKNDYAII